MVRIATFNANGIRSASRKGFFDWFQAQNIDVMCVQESKAHDHQLADTAFNLEGYERLQFDAEKKGYSGVMIYSRLPYEETIEGMGFPLCDTEGRFIAMRWKDVLIASVYFPSGTSGDHRQAQKYIFLDAFIDKIQALRRDYPKIILCGDVNIAHRPIDLENWQANQKCSGFLPEEREWMDRFMGLGWADAFRLYEKGPKQYSWWSYRMKARERNVGWRIDYHLITDNLIPFVQRAWIAPAPVFSDHAPVIIDYAFQKDGSP